MPDRAVLAVQLLEEDDVGELAAREEECGGVQVDLAGVGRLGQEALAWGGLSAQAHAYDAECTAVGLAMVFELVELAQQRWGR